MKSLSDSYKEFRKNQQTMHDCMTKIYEMLVKQSNGENSRGRTKLEKSRSAFLAMVAESTKQMKEPPCFSPAIQSLPIIPAPSAATITKKKKERVVEAKKFHPHQCSTKPPSIGYRLVRPSCKSKRQRSQTSKRVIPVSLLDHQSTGNRAALPTNSFLCSCFLYFSSKFIWVRKRRRRCHVYLAGFRRKRQKKK
jgi:hypothetical protein